MKTIALLLMLSVNQIKPDSVYLCTGSRSYAYHYKTDCRGLNHCTTNLTKVLLYDAVHKYHRKKCGYEKNSLN